MAVLPSASTYWWLEGNNLRVLKGEYIYIYITIHIYIYDVGIIVGILLTSSLLTNHQSVYSLLPCYLPVSLITSSLLTTLNPKP